MTTSDEKFYAQRDANFKERVYNILFDNPKGHSEEEVSSWLEELGYKNLDLVSSRQCPDFVPITHISCTGIEGKRSKPQD